MNSVCILMCIYGISNQNIYNVRTKIVHMLFIMIVTLLQLLYHFFDDEVVKFKANTASIDTQLKDSHNAVN